MWKAIGYFKLLMMNHNLGKWHSIEEYDYQGCIWKPLCVQHTGLILLTAYYHVASNYDHMDIGETA